MTEENIDNYSKESHKKILVTCDFQTSDKCWKSKELVIRDIRKTRDRNHGKDICLYCSRTSKSLGRNNPNCRYSSFNDSFMNDIDTPFKAWLLGWIASDGTLSQKSVVEISIKTVDEEVLYKMNAQLHGREPYRRKTKDLSNLSIYSIEFADACRKHIGELEVGKKSDKIQLPHLSDKLMPFFFRGILEGDGCITGINSGFRKIPKVEIATTSKMFRIQIKEYLGYGYDCNKAWEAYGQDAINFVQWIYNETNSAPFLDRKYRMYQRWQRWYRDIYEWT